MTTRVGETLPLNYDPQIDVCESGWYLECPGIGPNGLTRMELGRHQLTLGRGGSCDLCIPSARISKAHAHITVMGDLVCLRDLSSTNGTYVNGRRIVGDTPIAEGDLIQLADVEMCLRRQRPHVDKAPTQLTDQVRDGWLMSQLREVIDERRYHMVFQPLFPARGGGPVGVEALVRCQIVGLESPLQLFEAAARIGVEARVSRLLRTAAVEELGGCVPQQTLFLNTHPSESPGAELLESMLQLKQQAGERAIVLELHEGAVTDLRTFRDFAADLRRGGIGLAYDDFGAGRSRLMELTEAPPDFLKFDRRLVKNLDTAPPSHRDMVQSLVDAARQCGAKSVAEGIDSRDAARICGEMGFDLIQGFVYARPVRASQLTDEPPIV